MVIGQPEGGPFLDNRHDYGQLGIMIRTTISETKNRLSELLARVKKGETLIIADRKTPVARVMCLPDAGDSPHLSPPIRKWNPRSVLNLAIAVTTDGQARMVEAVREERESGW